MTLSFLVVFFFYFFFFLQSFLDQDETNCTPVTHQEKKRRSPSARKSLETAGTDKTRPFGKGKLVYVKRHCSQTNTEHAHSQGYMFSCIDASHFIGVAANFRSWVFISDSDKKNLNQPRKSQTVYSQCMENQMLHVCMRTMCDALCLMVYAGKQSERRQATVLWVSMMISFITYNESP